MNQITLQKMYRKYFSKELQILEYQKIYLLYFQALMDLIRGDIISPLIQFDLNSTHRQQQFPYTFLTNDQEIVQRLDHSKSMHS